MNNIIITNLIYSSFQQRDNWPWRTSINILLEHLLQMIKVTWKLKKLKKLKNNLLNEKKII